MDPKPQMPKIELATKEWTKMEIMDMDSRLEKSFKQQTQYMIQQMQQMQADSARSIEIQNAKIDNQTKWMIGLIASFISALIAIMIGIFLSQ